MTVCWSSTMQLAPCVISVCYLRVCFLNMTEGTLTVLEFPPVAACAFLLGHRKESLWMGCFALGWMCPRAGSTQDFSVKVGIEELWVC